MNSSAGQVVRKRRFGAVMVTVVALAGAVWALTVPAEARRHAHSGWDFGWGDLFWHPQRKLHRTVHAAKVPLPVPRPQEAPGSKTTAEARGEPEIPPMIRAPQVPSAGPRTGARLPSNAAQAKGVQKPSEQPSKQPPEEPAKGAAAPPPQPTACRQALTDNVAIAPSIPAIHGPGACGGEDLVRLEAIVLPDKRRVKVSPAATLRCPAASVIADWVRTDIAPLAQKLGSHLAELDNFESYDCRTFNGVKGAHLSEHGHANALDLHAFKLADGRSVELTDRSQPRELRENVLHSACTRFTTVLGPDSDWHHENHIHLDLMERHNNYRICQWDVLDPMPKIAPLVPADRPSEAPPRMVASRDEGKKEKAEKAKAGKADVENEAEKPPAAAHRSAGLGVRGRQN